MPSLAARRALEPAPAARPRPQEVHERCAWCARFRLGGWVAPAVALRLLGARSEDDLGRVSHGICEDCASGLTRAA